MNLKAFIMLIGGSAMGNSHSVAYGIWEDWYEEI